jgi:hypothetical protein
MGEHREAQLQVDTLITAQERQVAMRSRTGQDFDLPLFHEVAESTEHIAPKGVEEIKGLMVEFDPIIGQCRQVILMGVVKMRTVLSTGMQAGIEKNLQFLLQQWTGKLFA